MVDILAVSPHPDDAEIGCGGLLLLCKKQGYKTGILYMTEGEMGTEGTRELRKEETKESSRCLELDYFDWAGFQDCRIEDSFESRLKLAQYIRRLRPRIMIIPYWKGTPGRWTGHTDHLTSGLILSHAINFARLHKLPLSEKPHRVEQVFYYLFPTYKKPTFIVDITEVAVQWIEALKSHRSQFFGPHSKKTRFLSMIQARSKSLGFLIGSRYAQGFVSAEPLKIQNPFSLLDGPLV